MSGSPSWSRSMEGSTTAGFEAEVVELMEVDLGENINKRNNPENRTIGSNANLNILVNSTLFATGWIRNRRVVSA